MKTLNKVHRATLGQAKAFTFTESYYLAVYLYHRSNRIDFSFFDAKYTLLRPPEFHQELKIFLASDEDIYLAYQSGIFLKSLLYFEKADKETFPKLKPYWREIKEFFQKEVKAILFPCSR